MFSFKFKMKQPLCIYVEENVARNEHNGQILLCISLALTTTKNFTFSTSSYPKKPFHFFRNSFETNQNLHCIKNRTGINLDDYESMTWSYFTKKIFYEN